MEDDFALAITTHLSDLQSLATAAAGSTGIVARDTTNSIENTCRNLLDEHLSGAVALLLERDDGLCKVVQHSLENASRQIESLVDLRLRQHTRPAGDEQSQPAYQLRRKQPNPPPGRKYSGCWIFSSTSFPIVTSSRSLESTRWTSAGCVCASSAPSRREEVAPRCCLLLNAA